MSEQRIICALADAPLVECRRVAEAVAAWDAKWRAAVERVRWADHHPMCDRAMRENRVPGCCGLGARNAALEELLAAMDTREGA